MFAQLAMELKSNQAYYMQYEAIYMHLRIRNDSGRPIVFGKNQKLLAKLYFEVADVNGKVLEGFLPKAITLTRGKVINPGKTGDIVLKFSQIHQLNRTGIYRIHAYISHPMFKEQFKSNDVRIEISDGVKVWSRTIGVPDGVIDSNGQVLSHDSSRTYYIKKLNTSDIQYYYCTLEDNNKLYQIFRMGPVLGIEKPECVIDMSGALHMLVYILPKIYKYYKIDISGMDAAIQPGENVLQVLFVYDKENAKMDAFNPSDLKKELNDVAFKSQLGEFQLNTFEPSDMADRESFFLEAVKLVADAKEVKHLVVVPSEMEYGDKLPEIFEKVDGKESIHVLGMNPSAPSDKYRWEMLGYAVLQALGVRSDEI